MGSEAKNSLSSSDARSILSSSDASNSLSSKDAKSTLDSSDASAISARNAPENAVEHATLTIPPLPGIEEKEKIEELVKVATRECRETLAELASYYQEGEEGEHWAVFRGEQERLLRLLTRSVETSCREFETYGALHRACYENQHAVRLLAETTASDDTVIRGLRAQILRCNEAQANAHSREETLRNEVQRLKSEVAELEGMMSHGVTLSATQENSINELVTAKEEALSELEAENERNLTLQSILAERAESIQSVTAARQMLEGTLTQMREQCAQKKSEAEATAKRKEALETELRDARSFVASQQADIKTQNDAISHAGEEVTLVMSKSTGIKSQLATTQLELTQIKERAEKLVARRDQLTLDSRTAQQEIQSLAQAYKAREQQAAKANEMLARVDRAAGVLRHKIRLTETKMREADALQSRLEQENMVNLKERDDLLTEIDTAKANVDELSRARALLNHKQERLTTTSEEDSGMTGIIMQVTRNLEQELTACRKGVSGRTQHIMQLDSEIAEIEAEGRRVYEQAKESAAIVRGNEEEIFRLKKLAIETENKLKYQENLYDSAVADRNLQSRNLLDAHAEMNELRRQLKIIAFQISGLKEESVAKDEEMARAVAEGARLAHEHTQLEDEIAQQQQQNEQTQTYLRAQGATETRLAQRVKEAENEQQKQAHALAVAVAERDRLSSQLIKQDTEMRNAYDDIKGVLFSLLRGEKHYLMQRNVVRDLERQVRGTVAEMRCVEIETSERERMRRGVQQMKAELLEKACYERALEDALRHRVNIHPWRRLEGSSNSVLSTIQLAQALQRTLIGKRAAEEQQIAEMQEIEAKYLQLRNIATRQVGPEVLEQIGEIERVLNSKQARYQQMRVTLELLRAKIKEGRYTITSLERQCDEFKMEYFSERVRRESMAMEQVDCIRMNSNSDIVSQAVQDNDATKEIMNNPNANSVSASLVKAREDERREDIDRLEEALGGMMLSESYNEDARLSTAALSSRPVSSNGERAS